MWTATTHFLSKGNKFPGEEYAKDLNMDHLYLSFPEYLWTMWHNTVPRRLAALFGGPMTSGVIGILKMKIVEGLGFGTKNSPEVVERKLVDLILGTSLVTWITDITCDESGNLTGQLLLPQACHVLCDGTVTAGNLRILIDIRKRTILESWFLNKKLEMGDALSLTFLNGAVQTHPVIHSYANWGINPNSNNEFLRMMAICTIKYNNIGLTSFPYFVGILRRLRVLKYTTSDVARIVVHQGPHTVPPHAKLRHLSKDVKIVDFIVKVRQFFLREFVKHKDYFPGIDGEALFIGTVMHSIDHCQGPYILDDITDFRGSDEYLATRELATVILNCITDKHSFTLFERRFSHAPHQFWRSVYQFAATLNPRLADGLECTIAM